MNKKRIFIIIILIIIAGAAFLFFRQKQLAKQNGQTLRFRDFFTFSKKVTPDGGGAGNEQGGDFTNEGKTEVKDDGTSSTNSPIKTAFGTNQPFSPTISGSGGVPSGATSGGFGGEGDPNNGTGGSGGNGSNGTNGDNTPITPPGTPVDAPVCTTDDLEITFTDEEIEKLKALEARFYAIAPTLRSDQDVSVEKGNWSNYSFLNDTFADMTAYCQDATPALPEPMKRYLATPFYNDPTKNNSSFIDRTDGGREIDLDKPSNRYLGYIERFFRLNIW